MALHVTTAIETGAMSALIWRGGGGRGKQGCVCVSSFTVNATNEYDLSPTMNYFN